MLFCKHSTFSKVLKIPDPIVVPDPGKRDKDLPIRKDYEYWPPMPSVEPPDPWPEPPSKPQRIPEQEHLKFEASVEF